MFLINLSVSLLERDINIVNWTTLKIKACMSVCENKKNSAAQKAHANS